MATGTRSLPTNSPIPYFQPIEKGHMSEGIPSDIGSPGDVPHRGMQIPPHCTNLGETPYLPPGGNKYHPVVSESDRLPTYTGFNNYDTLFEASHCRGVIVNMPRLGEEAIATSSLGITPVTLSVGMTENPMVRIRPTPDSGLLPPGQKKHVSASADPSMIEHRVVSPVNTGHIIGEGAAIFTDMTEIMLTTLDQQMALSSKAQKPEGSLTDNVLIPG